jgi:hypothetical protein
MGHLDPDYPLLRQPLPTLRRLTPLEIKMLQMQKGC